MSIRFLCSLPFPKSLSRQFTLALSIPLILIIGGGLVSAYGLHLSSDTIQQLTNEHLVHLQDVQTLVRETLLIDLATHRLLTADSQDALQAGYLGILQRLDLLDATVLRLGKASGDITVLELYQKDQLYRNTVHIVAQLRRNTLSNLSASPGSAGQNISLGQFHVELERQALSLVDFARDLSARFTLDYQEKLHQLSAASKQKERWAIGLLAGSSLLALMISRFFLGNRVVARLQQVSNCLRLEETNAGYPTVFVQGDDEISEMARAVEHFLEEHHLLVEAQRSLRQNENMLQAIIEAAPVAIMGLDPDGNVHSVWNREAERMLGWSAPEVMGRPLPTITAENQARFREFREQIRKGLTLNGIEVTRQRRDGTLIHYSLYAAPLYDSEATITGAIAVLMDMEERRQMEHDLRLTQFSVDHAADGVYWISPDAHFIFVNEAACQTLGYSRSEMLTMGIFDIDPHFSMDIWQSVWKKIKKKQAFVFEAVNRRKDGTTFPVEVCINYIQFQGREYSCAFARDISQKKQAEAALRFERAQLQKKNEDLARSNAELDDFAYIVSHDLKEPLRSIHSFSSFLAEDYKDRLDDEGQAHLDIVKQSAQRMAALLDDLLIYSRVGRVHLAKKPTDLGRVAAGILDDMQIFLEEQNAHVLIAGDLPTVICDHVRIGEVFRNLIQNAVKYNEAAKKQIEVGWLPAKASEQDIPVFFVRDNGIGIREKYLDIIFKIFKRLHGRDKYGGGTGSGLTIVRKIIERHGGRIWVESEFGRGSTFYFTLIKDNKERCI
jgi:PAS domain S-box-containing protein